MKLNVKVIAQIDWIEPPKGVAERSHRNQANVLIQSIATKLEPAVKLLIKQFAKEYKDRL